AAFGGQGGSTGGGGGGGAALGGAVFVANGGTLNVNDGAITGLHAVTAGAAGAGGSGATAGEAHGGLMFLDGATTFNVTGSNIVATSTTDEIAGTGALTKQGAGALALNGDNSFTGGVTLDGGTLSAGHDNALGTGTLTVQNAATLDIQDGVTISNFTALQADLDINVGAGATGAHAGNIVGSQDITKTGVGTLELPGDYPLYSGNTNVNAGTLVVNGSIVNSATTVNAGGTLMGTGQLGVLTVLNGGIYAPGNSIGTQFVNGNFTLNPGAIFEVEVNAAGQSDLVVVTGTVNLTGASLRVLAEAGNYAPSTSYLIVDNQGAGAVIGTFAEVTSSLAFLTPHVNYQGGDGNDVVLTLIRGFTPTPDGPVFLSFCSVAVTKNQCSVAHALDKFPINNPLFLAVVTQTAAGARQAFDALSGEIHATLPGVLAGDARYVREVVLGRLVQASYTNNAGQIAALGTGGPQVASLNTASLDEHAMALGYGEGKSLSAPPPSYGSNVAFWTRAYGAWGDFDGNRNAASADRDLGGFVSGVDTQISGTWRAGLAAGGAWSNVSVGDRRSHAEVESVNLAGYVGGLAGPLALRGGGSWTWSDIDTSRAVIFPGFFERQSTSYDADTGQLFGEVAYPMTSGRIAFEPFAGLAYVNVEADSFRERGGALASLNGRGGGEDVGYSTLGLRAATVMHWNSTIVVPKVSAAWQHAFDDVTPGASLAFASTGIGFGITGVPLAQDSLLIEAGLDFNISPNATLGVSYSGQLASDVTDNAVKGRLSWLF
ncbi:MAG: autotransporter domain-containing protein, partial [Methyloceanibacter sp.]